MSDAPVTPACRHRRFRPFATTIVLLSLFLMAAHCATAEELLDETNAITIFAFDDQTIPYSQNLRLEMRQPVRHPENPVIERGPAGSVDAFAVQFYGSVIRDGDRFRMWYVAVGDKADRTRSASARWRPAYAESSDGVHWTKPNLGLVAYAGSTANNLVRLDPPGLGMVNLKVLDDHTETDPARRYKITTHAYFRDKRRLGTLAPFVSADGLTWQQATPATYVNGELSKDDLVLPGVHFEPCGGLYQWDGYYFICGQNAMNAPRSYQGRITRMYRSRDFVNWFPTSHVGFVRDVQHGSWGPGRSLEGEQCHEGISVWNRRNVLLGVVGLWHGATEWKNIRVDLGFVLSNNGLHFREPVHEWVFLNRGPDGTWDQGGLLQGQGFENVGEYTYIYYGAWDPRCTGQPKAQPRGGVGLAVLPRDRFGDLVVELAGKGTGDYQLQEIDSEFVTSAIELPKAESHRFTLNAAGLGPDAALRIDLLDAVETPLPGYSGDDAALVRQDGFQTPIEWNSRVDLTDLPDRIRLRVRFEGEKNTAIRFSALSIWPAVSSPD